MAIITIDIIIDRTQNRWPCKRDGLISGRSCRESTGTNSTFVVVWAINRSDLIADISLHWHAPASTDDCGCGSDYILKSKRRWIAIRNDGGSELLRDRPRHRSRS